MRADEDRRHRGPPEPPRVPARSWRRRAVGQPVVPRRRWWMAATTWRTTVRSTRSSAPSTTPGGSSRRPHAHGLRVLGDIVPNHTSSEHRLVQGGAREPAGLRRRATRYVFPGRARRTRRRAPNNWPSVSRRAGVDADHVARRPARAVVYLHLFESGSRTGLGERRGSGRVRVDRALLAGPGPRPTASGSRVAHGALQGRGSRRTSCPDERGLRGRRRRPHRFWGQDGTPRCLSLHGGGSPRPAAAIRVFHRRDRPDGARRDRPASPATFARTSSTRPSNIRPSSRNAVGRPQAALRHRGDPRPAQPRSVRPRRGCSRTTTSFAT